jgi:hypothetical protein
MDGASRAGERGLIKRRGCGKEFTCGGLHACRNPSKYTRSVIAAGGRKLRPERKAAAAGAIHATPTRARFCQ